MQIMDRVEYFKMLSAISGHVDVYYYFAIESYIHALLSKSILHHSFIHHSSYTSIPKAIVE